ncbi:MAG: uracil-DNA glycosylase [Bacteroidota bacterium]
MSHPSDSVQIEAGWKAALKEEFAKPYFGELKNFLRSEKQAGQLIYPPGKLIFNAFELTPYDQVKVVVIGQDPYHGPGQAHGLSFSVPMGIATPPSLKNIYKELHTDVGIQIPQHGNLEKWAQQGVLMLNAMLTVRARQAGSHRKKGWENFTSAVIDVVNREKEGVVFLLWGRYAQEKGALVDRNKHLVLQAPHPSPLARGGFFGCKHFSQTNAYLQKIGKPAIDWQV